MNEPERPLVEPGDHMTTAQGHDIRVDGIATGIHGLFWWGFSPTFIVPDRCWGFLPYELPPIGKEIKNDWCGWAVRDTMTLPSGMKVGHLGVYRSDTEHWTIEEYDAKWVLTKWQPEPKQSKPLPVGENVARMG
jgi:hypothetical protein